MSYEDNWESFINDESEQETKAQDSWDDITDEDFEDVLSVDDYEEEYESEGEYEEPEEKPTRPVRRVERVRDYEDEKPVQKKKKGGSGNLVTILIIAFAAIVIAALVILAVNLLGNKSETEATEETVPTTAYWQQEDAGDVPTLVNNYYNARVLQDTYTLSQVLDPSVTIDEAVLAGEAAVIEGYQNIVCYTTDGINTGEWAVYVSYDIKFKNINTSAPGLVAAYVKTDEGGNMRLIPWENVQKDEQIYNFIAAASDCDAVRQLSEEVYASYEAALASDASLDSYVKALKGETDEPGATEATEATQATQGGDTPTEATQAPEPTTEAPTTQAPTQGSSDFEPYDAEMYITKNDVNVRSAASTDAEVLKTLPKGQKVYVEAKNSEWYRYTTPDGKKAFIYKDFLSTTQP